MTQAYIEGLQRIAEKAMTEWCDGVEITSIRPGRIRARAKRDVPDIKIERAVRSVAEWFGITYGTGEIGIKAHDADEFWAEGWKEALLNIQE